MTAPVTVACAALAVLACGIVTPVAAQATADDRSPAVMVSGGMMMAAGYPVGDTTATLRTNAAGINLNREWHKPSAEKSPEVLRVLAEMDKTGVDFAMDIHGDEAIAANFLAGFEGVPGWTRAQQDLYDLFGRELVRLSPDFQTEKGYEIPAPGQANLSMSTAQLAERFGAVSMTLEMPFKDNEDLPDPVFGWSPERCRLLGRASLDALHAIADGIAAYRKG